MSKVDQNEENLREIYEEMEQIEQQRAEYYARMELENANLRNTIRRITKELEDILKIV